MSATLKIRITIVRINLTKSHPTQFLLGAAFGTTFQQVCMYKFQEIFEHF